MGGRGLKEDFESELMEILQDATRTPTNTEEEEAATAAKKAEEELLSRLEEEAVKVDLSPRHVILTRPGRGRSLRVVCVSDTHSLTHLIPGASIPAGDVLVHCGDFTQQGKIHEIQGFNTWLGTLPHTRKLVIHGNHEAVQ